MSSGSRLPGTPEPGRMYSGSGGMRIAGDSWGSPSDPLVVLMHGGGQTRHAWKDTGQKLAGSGYFVVALDARGHGDSDWSIDASYDLSEMAEDLREVVVAIGDPHPILVGASMGGNTALLAVGEGRVQARALVLVDTAPWIAEQGVERIRAFMHQHPNGFDSLNHIADAVAAYQPHRRRPRNLDGLSKNVRIGADGRYRWHWDPRYQSGTFDFAGRRRRLSACAKALRLPTLLVRGVLSDLLTEEGALDFLSLVRHAEYVRVSDAAHMIAGDQNDAFGNAMMDFLQRTAPAQR